MTQSAWARDRSLPDPVRISLEDGGIATPSLDWDIPVSGTVFGTLLNSRSALAALGDAVNAAPYKAPPQAPVLYIKPANTLIPSGAPIILPTHLEEVEIGATLGIVIGRTAIRVPESQAMDFVQGYVVVNDVSEPHSSVYRPAIRQRCRNGFCPVGRWVVERDDAPNPDDLTIDVHINGTLKARFVTSELIRPVARLIADVTDFMTLAAGDVLLIGTLGNTIGPPPRARAFDLVRIDIPGVGFLENPVLPEGGRQ